MSFDKLKPYIAATAASVIIYVITVLYVIFIAPALLAVIGRGGYDPLGTLLCIIIDFAIELAVIVIPIAVLAKKFRAAANILVMLILLFCLFAIYIPPWRYLFILTSEWGAGMLVKAAGMPTLAAAGFVSVQYSIIAFLVISICRNKLKALSSENKQ